MLSLASPKSTPLMKRLIPLLGFTALDWLPFTAHYQLAWRLGRLTFAAAGRTAIAPDSK
jgi:hypothetical protein